MPKRSRSAVPAPDQTEPLDDSVLAIDNRDNW